MSSTGGGIHAFIGGRNGLVVAVVALAAGLAVVPAVTGGGGGGGPTANVWVRTTSCDSTPTRQASPTSLAGADAAAIACTVAQATGAATTGDDIGVATGEHAGPVTWGDGTKTLEYIGEDGAVVDVGTDKPNYSGFQFEANSTVTNVDVCGSYPIVGMYADNIVWRDSTYCDTGIIRDCGADEPILIESDAAGDTAYAVDGVTVRSIFVDTQRAMNQGEGSCPPDDGMHLEIFRIGKGVENVTIENSEIADCPNGAGFDGCGTALIFLTTTAPGLFEPRNIVIRNNKFGSAPNATVKIHPNVTPCSLVMAYNTTVTETLVLNDSSACAGSSAVIVGNAGEKGSSCPSGVTFTRNIWTPSTGGNCGTDTGRASDLQLDANLDPEPGSPVIDAGETPGASDYCTGDLGSVDIDGTTRPTGSVCDAGAVEVS